MSWKKTMKASFTNNNDGCTPCKEIQHLKYLVTEHKNATHLRLSNLEGTPPNIYTYGDVIPDGSGVFGGNVHSGGNVHAGSNVHADGDVTAGGDISTQGGIDCSGSINVGGEVICTDINVLYNGIFNERVEAIKGVISLGNIQADGSGVFSGNVTAGDNVHADGDVHADGSGVFGGNLHAGNNIESGGNLVVRANGTFVANVTALTFTQSSDRRIKHDIQRTSLGLDFIDKLSTVRYKRVNPADYPEEILDNKYKGATPAERPADDESFYDGLIAQDVEQALIDIGGVWSGHTVEESTGKHTLQYGLLVLPLINAVKELKTRNNSLLQRLEAQQKLIDDIRNKLDM